VYIIIIIFFSETARIHVTVAAVAFAVCIIYSVYFVSHTDYTNIRKTYACSVRIPGDNQSTTQRFRGSGGGIRPLLERPRNIYIGSDSPHETKQKRPFPVSLHTYIYALYVFGRDDPLSLCKHAYTVYLRKDLYILFSRNDINTKLCTHYVYASVCVCFNVNVCLL